MITLPVEISAMVCIRNLKSVTGRMNTRLVVYIYIYINFLYIYIFIYVYIFLYTHTHIYKIIHKSAVCNTAVQKKSDSWHEQFCLESHLLTAVYLLPAVKEQISSKGIPHKITSPQDELQLILKSFQYLEMCISLCQQQVSVKGNKKRKIHPMIRFQKLVDLHQNINEISYRIHFYLSQKHSIHKHKEILSSQL